MGRSGITYTEVAHAANTLIEAGITPTIEKIRAKIGMGSYTTIATFLKQWKDKHPTEHLAQTEGLPAPLVATMKELWQQLQELAQQQVLTIQEQTLEQIATAEQVRNEATQLAQTHEAKIAELETLSDSDNNQITLLKAQLMQAQITAKENDGLIEHLKEQSRSKKTDNQRLHALTQQLHQNLEHFQESSATQRQQEQLSFQEQKTTLEQQINTLTHTLYQHQNTIEHQTKNAGVLNEKLSSAQDELATQSTALLLQQKHHDALKHEINNEQAKTQSLDALLEHEKNHYITLQTRYDALLLAHTQLQIEQAALKAKFDNKEKKRQNNEIYAE